MLGQAERTDASIAERVKRYCGKEGEEDGPSVVERAARTRKKGDAAVFAHRQEQDKTGTRERSGPR